jgi:aminoglycoside phosphotransferase (APT) family kinase protein
MRFPGFLIVMPVNIEYVNEILMAKGIRILPRSLELYNQQGRTSKIFKVDSNKGSLAIKISEHSERRWRYEKAEKEFYMSQLLAQHLTIPTLDFYAYGSDAEGNVFTVRKFAEGKNLREGEYHVAHLRHLAQIVARLHQIDIEGAGDVYFKSGKPCTTHKNWHSFLLHSSCTSLDQISRASRISREEYDEYMHKIRIFFKEYHPHMIREGKLLHGDLIEENIVIEDDQINAIIDFEYSCVGDPAWDFAGPADCFQHTLLKHYLKEIGRLGLETNKEDFMLRIRILAAVKALAIANSYSSRTRENDKPFRLWWSKFCRLISEMM